jgi:hypothetical protein
MVISGRRAVSSRKFQRIAPPPRVLKQRAMTIEPVNSPLIVIRPFGPSRATEPPSCSILVMTSRYASECRRRSVRLISIDRSARC